MIEAMEAVPEAEVEDLTASDVLTAIRARRAAEDRAAAAAFTVPGSDHEEPIAGSGCPLVAEFCIAELGAVLGISTTSAKKLIGHALELRHRLPRLWAQVQSGQVPAWRARAVAETTIHTAPSLTVEAVAWVDSQVAAVAGRMGAAQLDRLVAETIKRHDLAVPDPTADPEDGYLAVDPRHATLHDEDVHFAGTMRFEAELDLADALDLDRALAQKAAEQQALGSAESLGVRRSKALGDLARTQTALDLLGADVDRDRLPAAREVVLHAHFDATVIGEHTGEQTVFGPIGRIEEGQRLVLLEQVTSWCGDSRTKITIKPVIDLNVELTAPGDDIPDRIREQVVLRDRACVFPWCTRPARGCDVDHVIPHDHDADAGGREQPGPTVTSNLAALCRRHHRLKTHTAWRYQVTGPGEFEWTSPHGHTFRRELSGTVATARPREPDRP